MGNKIETDVLKRLEQKYDKHANLAEQTKKILDNVELLRGLDDGENRIRARYRFTTDYYHWPLEDLPSCDIFDKLREIKIFNQINGNIDGVNYQIQKVEERIKDRKLSEKDYKFLMNNPPKYLIDNCLNNIYKSISGGNYLSGNREHSKCLFLRQNN